MNDSLFKAARNSYYAEPVITTDVMSLFPEFKNVSPNDLEPVPFTQRNRVRKKLVVGIPVVERAKSYITDTLTSLFSRLDEVYRSEVLFVVMFGSRQTFSGFVMNTTKEIKWKFAKEVDDGLLQIIAIPEAWYKINIEDVPPTFNDKAERMYWRTKQNIALTQTGEVLIIIGIQEIEDICPLLQQKFSRFDKIPFFAFIVFLRVVFNYVTFLGGRQWFYMDFSRMGFIGKLFRTEELKYVVHSVALYYRYKPVDWILLDIQYCRYCRPDQSMANCNKVIKGIVIGCGATQFQHVGKVSSLSGKVQNISDKYFGKGKGWSSRNNPLAKVSSTMKCKSGYEPQRGYANNNAIWFLNIAKGGRMIVTFSAPITVTGIMLLSGVPPAAQGKFGPETNVYVSLHGSDEDNKTLLGAFSLNGDFLFRSCGTRLKSIEVEVTEDLLHDVVVDHFIIDTGVHECLASNEK
ncbi:unnamed protein product [Nippostrongylus brasiliensis]|uniref:Protein LOC152586 (inferred by orthology to a human protein) n=1 Tax=Nippostrongylus brasiliensis TaxID=27835 RepID=A0A0N4YC85_NIPBR|nr:unnamed protein product [Nippostrongylus brasiliensis]